MKLKLPELQIKKHNPIRPLLLFTFFSLLILAGCNDDDNNYIPIYAPPTTQDIDGAWDLANVSGGIAGTSDDFAPGEVTWVFNDQNQTVQVFNSNTDENRVDFFDSGTYDYQVVINQATPELCGFNFEIDAVNLGCFTITEEQFTMSMIEADGHIITLKRPQVIPFKQ